MRAARANTSLTAQSNVSRCRGLPKQNQFRFSMFLLAGLGLGLDFGWTKLGFHASFTNVFVCLDLELWQLLCICVNVATVRFTCFTVLICQIAESEAPPNHKDVEFKKKVFIV